MKNIFYMLAILFASLIINISCKKNTEQPDILHSIQLPANATDIVSANSNFAFDFFHATLQTDNTTNNKLISPLSIYFALSMLYNGADGATKDSIQDALRLRGISIDDINNTCKALLQQMPLADSRVNLSVANSIWYQQTLQPLQSFLDVNSNYYNAEIKALNFADPSSVNIINNWISQQTHGKINKVLNELDGILYLINAVYFKGNWKIAFDTKATANASFTALDGSSVSTPFMYMKQSLKYLNNDTLQMVELPYGGGNFNMYVMLPNNIPMVQFATLLDRQSFLRWQSNLDSANLNLYLPKFTYAYSIDNMRPELALMGMDIAFTGDADFSKMYKGGGIQVGTAIHKTYIDVDETGTEAAAVTVIGVYATSVPAIPTIKINHPFVYVIQEKTSGEILFIGMVNNPANT